MPVLTYEGVQVNVPSSADVQLAFSAAGELTIRCANFTGDLVLTAKAKASATLPSPRTNGNKRMLRSIKHGNSFDASDSDDTASYVNSTSSSVLDLPQKRQLLESIKIMKKSKLSTAPQPPPRTLKMNKSRPQETAAARTAASQSRRNSGRLETQLMSNTASLDDSAMYFQALTERENSEAIQEESEDFCFICRDGGVLIECDWDPKIHNSCRCPKVYHEECLGYSVPESVTVWNCPRHYCQLCDVLSKYSCRFCVTSYCAEHVPREIKKVGPASRDIPGSTYIVCQRCERDSQRALETGKLSSKSHSLMFRPPLDHL